jgi:hypothetical protein
MSWPNLVFSADGGALAFLVPSFDPEKDEFFLPRMSVRLSAIEAGAVRQVPLSTSGLVAFALAPDGKTLASITEDRKKGKNVLTVWEIATGKPRSQSWALADPQDEFGPSLLAFAPDGRLLVSAIRGRTFQVWDPISTQEMAKFTGHEGPLHALAFAEDGRRVLTGSEDTTALSWDLTKVRESLSREPLKLSDEELQARWRHLLNTEGREVATALADLTQARAVNFIQKNLVIPKPDEERIARLIAELNDKSFKVRQAAAAELEKLGEDAEPALRRTLPKAPPLEVVRRAEAVLAVLALGKKGESLRQWRALELLERIGTAEARAALRQVAQSEADTLLRTEARRVLARLGVRDQ